MFFLCFLCIIYKTEKHTAMKRFIFYLFIFSFFCLNHQNLFAEEKNNTKTEHPRFNDEVDYCLDPYVDYENKDKLKTNEELIREMDLALQDSLNQFEDCIEINYQGSGSGSGGGSGGGSGSGSGGGSGSGSGGGSGGGSGEGSGSGSGGGSGSESGKGSGSGSGSESGDGSGGGSSDGKTPTKNRKVPVKKSDIGKKPGKIVEQDKNILARQIKEYCDSLTDKTEKDKCLDEYKRYK